MQGIGADGDGARGNDGAALQNHQCRGQGDGQHHHGDAGPSLSQGGGMQEAVGGFIEQEHGRAADKDRLAQAGQGFCLGMAEAVLAIGRTQGMAHGEPIEARGQAVQQGVHQATQQGHRAGGEPGNQLGKGQQHCHRHRRMGGQAHEPVAGMLRGGSVHVLVPSSGMRIGCHQVYHQTRHRMRFQGHLQMVPGHAQ